MVSAEEVASHYAVKKVYIRGAVQACAWIPSCIVAGCDTKCVANIYGENKVMDSLEHLYTTAMMCTAVSSVVKATAVGMAGRRLQVLLGRAFLH